MLLAVDVGNTETVIGLFDEDSAGPAGPAGDPAHHWRAATVAARTADEHALLIAQLLSLAGLDLASSVTGIAICSVVPRAQSALRQMAEQRLGVPAVIVGTGVRTGMPILYENPRDVGADRIANAVGALERYGAPVIVVDFGTATTIDFVSVRGEYLGGAIAPGIEISLDALVAHASLLRRVELVEPRSVIGRSTIESLQSGVIFGYAAMADGLCGRAIAELGECPVVATGGLAELIAPYCSHVAHHDPWLTLHGLRLIYARNVSGGSA